MITCSQYFLPYVAKTPNVMADVNGFINRWSSQLFSTTDMCITHSPWGNINSIGGDHLSDAPDLTPNDRDWCKAIEPGVAPLVNTIINNCGLITYDSCEGHLYPPELKRQPGLRRVGILPRNHDEFLLVYPSFLATMQLMKKLCNNHAVELSIVRTHLYSEATPNRTWTVIDIELVPKINTSWKTYFDEINTVSDSLLLTLSEQSFTISA